MSLHGPFRRITTTHAATDTDGTLVEIHDDIVPLRPALSGAAGLAPLYATLGLPATNPHNLTPEDISQATLLAPGVVTPNGVNAQVTDLAPGAKVGMHRSNSLDYNVFIFGSAYLVTPDGEGGKRTLVSAGQVVVQTGTIHAWEAGPEGARWCTVVVAAEPVVAGGSPLPEVDF